MAKKTPIEWYGRRVEYRPAELGFMRRLARAVRGGDALPNELRVLHEIFAEFPGTRLVETDETS